MHDTLKSPNCKHGMPAYCCAVCMDTARRASRPSHRVHSAPIFDVPIRRLKTGPYNPIPHLTDDDLARLFALIRQDSSGCMIWEPSEGAQDRTENITIRGERFSVPRIMYYLTHPEHDEAMDTHEVIHVPECLNVGAFRAGDLYPLCVNPAHLQLGDRRAAAHNAQLRGGQ